MGSRVRHGMIVLAAALIWASPAVHGASSLVLESTAPAAHMSLRGDVSLTGTGALPIGDLPVGEYRFFAEGPGLPAVKGRLVRTENGLLRRAWAGPTSFLMPPGFVHLEHGESRGWTLMAAGIAGGALAGISQAEIGTAEDDVAQAERAYAWSVSEEAIEEARWDLQAALSERDDLEEVRNLWLGFLAVSWLGAGLETVLLTPQPSLSVAGPGRIAADLPAAGGFSAAVRSALLPGGGQRYMGRDGRASFFFTATAALTAATVAAHDAFLEARREQAEAQYRFDRAEEEAEMSRTRRDLERAADRVDEKSTLRWALAGAAAGVYAWNILDAALLGGQTSASALTWSVDPTAGGVAVCASWRFQ